MYKKFLLSSFDIDEPIRFILKNVTLERSLRETLETTQVFLVIEHCGLRIVRSLDFYFRGQVQVFGKNCGEIVSSLLDSFLENLSPRLLAVSEILPELSAT